MNLPQGTCLATLVLSILPVMNAADQHPTPDSVWTLDQIGSVGGHTAAILGEPSVATEPDGKAVFFNGVSDGLFVQVNPLAGLAQFTVEALIKPASVGPAEQRFLHVQDDTGSRLLMEIRLTDAGWALDTFLRSEKTGSERPLLDRTKLHPAERWTWVALVYANGHMTHYVNGVKELEGAVAFAPMADGQISLGVRQNKVYWFKGGVREVRFHGEALGPDALQHR